MLFIERLKNATDLIAQLRPRHFKRGIRHLSKMCFLFFLKLSKDSSVNLANSWRVSDFTIGVILTVYNQTALELMNCLKSLRDSSLPPSRVLIYNDGSTSEETLNFLKTVSLYENEQIVSKRNKGVVRARNEAAGFLKTDYLLFLDPDDSLYPEFLARAYSAIQRDRRLDIVYADAIVKREGSSVSTIWKTGPFNPAILKHLNTIPLTSLVRRSFFFELNGFCPTFETGFEDWDFWCRCSLSGAVVAKVKGFSYLYTRKAFSRTSIMLDNSELIKQRFKGCI